MPRNIIPPVISILVLAFASLALGQTTPKPAPVSERAEKTLSRAVVRISATVEGQTNPMEATGFVVTVPDDREPGLLFPYLVTNRHVAAAIFPDPDGTPRPHKILEMNAFFNLKQPVDGTRSHAIALPPKGEGLWYLPTDPSVDLAIISIAIDNTYDVAFIGPNLFLTPDVWDKYRIVPGDKLLTCGFFLHYAGSHQFQPILREGSLAMVPDDVMPVPIGGSAKVYLADLHIIRGNSGSPLFLAPSFTLGGYVYGSDGGLPYGLLGVVSGYMWEDNQLTLHAATDYEGTLHGNSGIAMVVPVEQLKNLLYRADLQASRDNTVARDKANAPH